MADTGSAFTDFSAFIVTFIVGATVLVLVYISSLLKASKTEAKEKCVETEVPKKEKHVDNVSASHKASKKKQEKWTRDPKQNFSNPWLLTSLKGHSGRVLDMDFSSNGKYLATCSEEDTEELDPGGDCSELGSGNSSGSEGNKENSPQGSGVRGCKGAMLSRRQKKNRVRRDDGSPVTGGNANFSTKKHKSKSKHSSNSGNGNKRQHANAPALRQHGKLNLCDSDLSVFLRHYVLTSEELLGLGYPVDSALYPGRAIIYKNPAAKTPPNNSSQTTDPLTTSSHFFDVNAQEFVPNSAKQTNNPCYYNNEGILNSQDLNSNMYVSNILEKGHGHPGMDYSEIGVEWHADHGMKNEDSDNIISATGDGDSGTNPSGCEGGSSSSSQEVSVESDVYELGDEALVEEETRDILEVQASESSKLGNVNVSKSPLKNKTQGDQWCGSDERKCVRCGRGFFVTNDGEYLTQEHCLYHWGKLQKVISAGSKDNAMTVRMEYSCCRGKASARGCTTGKLHVWYGLGEGINGPFDGFVRTRSRKTPPPDGNFGVYALDCEMCFTTRGLELTKVTVVATDGRLVYDCLVRPENFIIDYNTRFSGITARDLGKRSTTKSLRDVQNDLMGFINADTILIGHGLENDLRALRIIHYTVIDTSVAFPHYYGLPYRRSLKSLVGCLLKRDIQQDSSGHDSFEDARACVELMLWRIRKDFRTLLEN